MKTHINHDNVERIKKLADKIEYTITNIKKVIRISTTDEYQLSWDTYTEDMKYLYSEVKNDIVAIHNANEREYNNIFNKDGVDNGVDLNRLKLTKKEKSLIENIEIDVREDGYISILWEQDHDWVDIATEKQKEAITKKVKKNLITATQTARGYSQRDWEKYLIVYYNDTKNIKTINTLLENIQYLFTVCEYSVRVIHIETRLYTSGIKEDVEVEQDNFFSTSYSGNDDNETLGIEHYIKKGYVRENTN